MSGGTRVKRGHFVPQGYLKAFANPEKAGQIFVMRRSVPGKVHLNPICKVASKRGFYDGPDDQEQVLERWFSEGVETDFPPLITLFLERTRRYGRLQPVLLDKMLQQMAVQFFRTRQARQAVANWLEQQAEVELWPTIQRTLASQAGFSNVSLVQIEADLNGPEHAGLLFNEANRETLVSEFQQFTWQLHTTTPELPFLTSDAPVLIQRLSSSGKQEFQNGSVVCFPLTPTALLFGVKTGQSLRALGRTAVFRSSAEDVGLINAQIYLWAHEQVFSSSKAALLAACTGDQTSFGAT